MVVALHHVVTCVLYQCNKVLSFLNTITINITLKKGPKAYLIVQVKRAISSPSDFLLLVSPSLLSECIVRVFPPFPMLATITESGMAYAGQGEEVSLL